MKPFQQYLDKAEGELSEKTLHDIQVDTAMTWCARACVSARKGFLEDAKEYGHEAIEHAALSGLDELLKLVRQTMASYGVIL